MSDSCDGDPEEEIPLRLIRRPAELTTKRNNTIGKDYDSADQGSDMSYEPDDEEEDYEVARKRKSPKKSQAKKKVLGKKGLTTKKKKRTQKKNKSEDDPPVVQRRSTRSAATLLPSLQEIDSDVDDDEGFGTRHSGAPEPDSDDDPEWGDKKKSKKRGRFAHSSSDEMSDTEVRPKKKKSVPKPSHNKYPKASPKRKTNAPKLISPAKLNWKPDPNAKHPHSYLKCDFVIDKLDMTTSEPYPVWKIDSGRLLQKFEPHPMEEGSDKLIHKSVSTYSSWTGDIRQKFQGILVRNIQQSRGQWTVEVLPEYQPKAPLEDEQIQHFEDSFRLYLCGIILKAAAYVAPSKSYPAPGSDVGAAIEGIDEKLLQSKAGILHRMKWTDKFQNKMDDHPVLVCIKQVPTPTVCQATEDESQNATKALSLQGEMYDKDTLVAIPETSCFEKFAVGERTYETAEVYHNVVHFKHNIFNRCTSKIKELKVEEEDDIVELVLEDHDWFEAEFEGLKVTLDKANKLSAK